MKKNTNSGHCACGEFVKACHGFIHPDGDIICACCADAERERLALSRPPKYKANYNGRRRAAADRICWE